jgi:hypothetical protein
MAVAPSLSPPCFPQCASPVIPSAGAGSLPPRTPRRRQSGKASSLGHLAAHPLPHLCGANGGRRIAYATTTMREEESARLRRRGRRRVALLHLPPPHYCSSNAAAVVPNALTITRCRRRRTPAASPVGSPSSSARSMVIGSSPLRSRSRGYNSSARRA